MGEGEQLPVHDDITDPRVAKAMAHPLRVRILNKLDQRVASPSEISEELGVELTHVSYHVRKLASLGLVELVRRTPRRGAIEHHYRAKVRPKITHSVWSDLPTPVKRAMIGASIDQAGELIEQAAGEGGFDRPDIHLTRNPLQLDEKGWKAVTAALDDLLAKVSEIADDCATRAADGKAELSPATLLMMFFEGPADATGTVVDGSQARATA